MGALDIGADAALATADLGIICGWVAYDHGDQALTRRLYSEAQLLAGSSGDAELQVHVLVNMAMQSNHLASLATQAGSAAGFAREGLRLADQAGDIAPARALATAAREYDEVPGGHEVGYIEWIDYRSTAELPMFPPIGPALAALSSPYAAVTSAALPQSPTTTTRECDSPPEGFVALIASARDWRQGVDRVAPCGEAGDAAGPRHGRLWGDEGNGDAVE
ncbi:hypothetical protein SMC26_20185 [Actinomadura fulvescens]|uniref:hypothetical protein n=1 Tax=Actinomadura fulvescens TaxID=46160 RepID=UPI0031D0EDCA